MQGKLYYHPALPGLPFARQLLPLRLYYSVSVNKDVFFRKEHVYVRVRVPSSAWYVGMIYLCGVFNVYRIFLCVIYGVICGHVLCVVYVHLWYIMCFVQGMVVNY